MHRSVIVDTSCLIIFDKIKPLIDKLIKTDFRISDKVIDDLLKRNNE